MKLTDEDLERMLKSMDLEEPSMSFNRKVMDQVALQASPVIMKTVVDKRIIYSIATVFIAGMIGMFIFAAFKAELRPVLSGFDVDFNFTIDKSIYSALLKCFIFIDLVLGLFYFDRLLRKRIKTPTGKVT